MAKQIKRFWVRLAAMFITLYFAPLSNFITSLFGIKNSGTANAAIDIVNTIYCNSSDPSQAGRKNYSCLNGGTDNQIYITGTEISCSCGSSEHPKMVEIVVCSDNKSWNAAKSDWDHYYYWDKTQDCTPECNNNQTRDCSSTARYCTQTCDNDTGRWGSKQWGACKSGYVMVSGSCVASCYIANGDGYEIQIAESSSSSSSSQA